MSEQTSKYWCWVSFNSGWNYTGQRGHCLYICCNVKDCGVISLLNQCTQTHSFSAIDLVLNHLYKRLQDLSIKLCNSSICTSGVALQGAGGRIANNFYHLICAYWVSAFSIGWVHSSVYSITCASVETFSHPCRLFEERTNWLVYNHKYCHKYHHYSKCYYQ